MLCFSVRRKKSVSGVSVSEILRDSAFNNQFGDKNGELDTHLYFDHYSRISTETHLENHILDRSKERLS